MIAMIRFQSPEVRGALSPFSFAAVPAVSKSRWSTLNGFLPASPRAFPFAMNQMASINRKIAQIRNTVLKLVLIPNSPVVASIAMKVVPTEGTDVYKGILNTES